jgi:hypothetical protein
MKFKSSAFLIAGILLISASAWAQESRAVITGVVTDPGGAVVPAASIVAKDLDTNVVTNAVTNDKGIYLTEPINPGHYSVTITKTGFKTVIRPNIELRQSDRLPLDVQLELGGTADSITISADATMLTTEAATQSTLINQTLVQDLPTYGDDPYYIIGFTAGVQQSNGKASTAQRPFDGGETGFNINGLGSNESTLDGSTNTARESGGLSPGIVAPTDAIGEVNIITNLFDAQYGRTGGAVVSASLKSGTNAIHGSIWWFNRNPVFNANTFDSNAARQPKASYKLNEPGFSVSGPVILPKVYNGKNKTFFMYTYERFRDDRPQASSTVTPTGLQDNGDFSQTFASGTSGPTVQIYDPLSSVVVTSPSLSVTRTSVSGGVIPPSRINPVAAHIAGQILAPNIGGVARGIANLVEAPNYDHEPYDVHIFRLDQTLGKKSKAFVDVGRSNRHQTNGLGNNAQGYTDAATPWLSTSYTHWRIEHELTVGVTTVLSPSMVSNAQISFNRHQFAIDSFSALESPTAAGFPATAFLGAQAPAFPAITFAGNGGYGGLGRSGIQLNFSNNYSARETLSKVIGKHSLKVGVEGRDMRNNQNNTPGAGTIAFSAGYTQQNALVSTTTSGDPWASFLLGYPTTTSTSYVNPATEGQQYWNVFLQDDWRIGKKLTLNLGLRWDYETPITDRYNHIVDGFDPATVTNLGGPTGPAVKGGLLFASGSNRLPYKRDLNNFGPRVGFAYQISKKAVVRGGWGIVYNATFDVAQSSGYSFTTSPSTSVNNQGYIPLTFGGQGMLSTPFPNGIQLPSGNSLGLQTFVGQNISYINPDRVVPYDHTISVGFQYELPWRSVVEVSWNATISRELETSFNRNSITYQQYYTQLWPNGNNLTGTTVTNPYLGLAPGTSLGTTATMSLQQSLLPYSQFTGVTETGVNNGTSNYEAVQIRYEKRLSQGLTVLANTTLAEEWNHNAYLNSGLDAIGAFITQNQEIQPWVFNLSFSYKLPFFEKSHGLLRTALGGWQLSGTETKFPGGYINICGNGGTLSCTGVNPKISNPTVQRGFNTCTLNNSNVTNTGGASVLQNCQPGDPVALILNRAGTLLTEPNPQFSGFRAHVPQLLNFSLAKSFRIKEHSSLDFRAEAFNATNTPAFGAPSTTATSSLYGVTTLTQSNDPRSIELSLKLRF